MSRPRRFPLVRLGLTLVVGSVLASAISFYIGVGQSMAELQQEPVSTEPRDLLEHFTRNFLFAGATPGILFYGGLAFMLLGIIRNFVGRPGAAR